MGAGGVPNRTIERVNGRSGDLPITGAKPNSRYDLYVNGKKIQSRWYDKKGNAVRNRDYSHQSRGQISFPHDHIWDNGARNKEHLTPDYDNYY